MKNSKRAGKRLKNIFFPMHWTNISNDPNSPEVIKRRKEALKAARQKPVANRIDYIKQLAAGKSVLDVGIVDHLIGHQHSLSWLHGQLASVASKILGVDILPEAVEQLKTEGYNVRLYDVTKQPLDEKFDLIVVGEVIEHLNNPCSLFESAKKMLAPGGRLVLTTPNPYYVARIRDNLRFGFGSDSVDHVTLLFPFGISELAERAGLKLDSWRGIKAATPPTAKGKMILNMLKLLPLSPESLCDAMIYECASI